MEADSGGNSFTYFSGTRKPFESYAVERIYGTLEQDFTRVGGELLLCPERGFRLVVLQQWACDRRFVGEEMKVKFGYDVLGDGAIEWMPGQTIKTFNCMIFRALNLQLMMILYERTHVKVA